MLQGHFKRKGCCCWLLLAAGCWLLATTGCWLQAAGYCWLLPTPGCCPLLAAGCWLLPAAQATASEQFSCTNFRENVFGENVVGHIFPTNSPKMLDPPAKAWQQEKRPCRAREERAGAPLPPGQENYRPPPPSRAREERAGEPFPLPPCRARAGGSGEPRPSPPQQKGGSRRARR